jgi:energy-coupling factor transport system permease protein
MYPPVCIMEVPANATHASASPARPGDPRALLGVVFLVVVAAIATIRTIPAMGATLAFVCGCHALVTGRPAATLRALARIVPLAIVIVGLNALLVSGEPLVSVSGWRVVSREGLLDGCFFSLRLAVMLTAVALLISGAAPESLARGAHDLLRRLSAGAAAKAAFFVFLSMGFVPLFADEIQRIRMAQSFRGGDFSGGLWRRVGSARAWLVPLLVSAVHRSGQLALAVELRDIRTRLVHGMEKPRARAADVILVLATAIVVVAASLHR